MISIINWIFLTPMYKNKELVLHCATKAQEYKSLHLDILADNFDVLIYDIDFFISQIPIVNGTSNNKVEINIDRDKSQEVDWRTENIPLVNNALTKHSKRVKDGPNKTENVNKLTEFTIGDFINEQQIVNKWRELYPNDYERFLRLISDYEMTVETMCITNTNDNNKLYERIQNELKGKIKSEFHYLNDITIEKLTKGVMADWILRCPINFD